MKPNGKKHSFFYVSKYKVYRHKNLFCSMSEYVSGAGEERGAKLERSWRGARSEAGEELERSWRGARSEAGAELERSEERSWRGACPI